jgi:thiol-disulfide isomerase/thioredoxin
MVHSKKTKKSKRKEKVVSQRKISIHSLILVCILSFSFILFWAYFQKIDIIYFTNSKCKVSEHVDEVINFIENEFDDKVNIEKIEVKIFPNDDEDSEYVSKLREKYNIYGVPTIIINGKVFNKPYTKENLVREICNKLIFKPRICEENE